MPKKCTKFVSEYLIPSLNTQKFGERLKWIDKKNSVFQLDWCHKGGPTWTENEAEVFVEWDKIKGHYQPEDVQYFTKSKQRFRSLLYKLTSEGQIKKLTSDDKYKKVYSIGEKKRRQRKRNSKDSYPCGVFCSTVLDEMSSEDKDSFITDERSYRKGYCKKSELEDHNYCSLRNSLNAHSDYEDQTFDHYKDYEDQTFDHYKDYTVPASPYGLPENSEKKVLTEQIHPNSSCVLARKDMNDLNDIIESMLLDEDLQMDFKNLTSTRTGVRTVIDSPNVWTLGYLMKKIDENLLPTEILEPNEQANLPHSEEINLNFNIGDYFVDSNCEEFGPTLVKFK